MRHRSTAPPGPPHAGRSDTHDRCVGSAATSFTPAQRAGLDTRTADQDRTLDTMHRLEAALGRTRPRQRDRVAHGRAIALKVLEDVTRDEDTNATLPDSLLSDIKRTQPSWPVASEGSAPNTAKCAMPYWAPSRARTPPDHDDGDLDYSDTRQRLAWILTALRHQRAHESDLIYEAYYDAFRSDLDVDTSF